MSQGRESNPENAAILTHKNESLTQEWGGAEKQKRWESYSQCALQRCLAWLSQVEQPQSLQAIYYFLADERMKIARLLGHNIDYGVRRYRDEVLSSFDKERLRTKNMFPEMLTQYLRLHGNLAGTQVSYKKKLKNDEIKIIFKVRLLEEKTFYVKYPSKNIVSEMLESANTIWHEIYVNKYKLTDDRKYFQLGRILWHLALARPLELGSAATGEYTYHILTQLLGLPFFAINFGNKSWDVWAMMHHDEYDFADWFSKQVKLSLRNTSVSVLHPYVGDDQTTAIIKEANQLLDLNYNAACRDFPKFETLDRVDPYGFHLFHHYIMQAFKRYPDPDDNDKLTQAYDKAYQMLPNGQMLFLEALQRVPKIVDPIMFMLNLFDDGADLDIAEIKKRTDKIFILTRLDNFHRDEKWLSRDCNRQNLLNTFDYLIRLTVIPEIHQHAKLIQEQVKTMPIEGDLLAAYIDGVDCDEIEKLSTYVCQEKPYTTEQLVKICRVTKSDEYFKQLTLDDWLRPGDDGCLLDQVPQYTVFACQACQSQQDFEKILNHFYEKYYGQTKFTTCINDLLYVVTPSNLFAPIKHWLDQHPDVNILPALLDSTSNIPLTVILPELFSDRKVNLSLDYLLSRQNIFDPVYLIEFLAERGMNLSLLPTSQSNMRLRYHLRTYILNHSKRDICLAICEKLEPGMLKQLISDFIMIDNKGYATKFCGLFNDLATVTNQSSTLFASQSNIDKFRQGMTSGICSLIDRTYLYGNSSAYAQVEIFFKHLNFLDREALLSCKSKVKETDNDLMALIDNQLKKMDGHTPQIM